MAKRPADAKTRFPQGTWLPEPARGHGARRAVPVERVLRPARPAPGQVRDAAPRARGRCAGEPRRRELRRLAAHLVSGAARLGSGRAAGPAAGPPGAPPARTSSATRWSRLLRAAKNEHPELTAAGPGRAGARALRHLGPSPQHRPRPRAGKKTMMMRNPPCAGARLGAALRLRPWLRADAPSCRRARHRPRPPRARRGGAARRRGLATWLRRTARPAGRPVLAGLAPGRCPPGSRRRRSTS